MEGHAYANQRVMVLAPHADDEAIGCAGVIQKYIRQNSPVRVLVVSLSLNVSRRYKKELSAYANYDGNVRLREFQQAMSILGVTDTHIFFPDKSKKQQYDSKLDTHPRAMLVEKIERHIEEFRPTVMFIPSITKHQDHEATHQAAIAATRPYFWNGSVFVYETDGELSFDPNFFVPLSEPEMNRKMEALQAYQTQLGNSRHPVNPDSLFHKAKFRGNQIYEDFAEAFRVHRLHG
ncbi:MAG TPA: PIG-L deacetylase family protein [Bacilli bacterium]